MRLVPVAFISGMVYLIIFLITEFADCIEKVQEGYPRVQREILTQAIMFTLVDLVIVVAILWGLANTMWKFHDEILRGFGSDPSGRWCDLAPPPPLAMRSRCDCARRAQASRMALRGCAHHIPPPWFWQARQGEARAARGAGAPYCWRGALLCAHDSRHHRGLHHSSVCQSEHGPSAR